jgi:hypothetical protein
MEPTWILMMQNNASVMNNKPNKTISFELASKIMLMHIISTFIPLWWPTKPEAEINWACSPALDLSRLPNYTQPSERFLDPQELTVGP